MTQRSRLQLGVLLILQTVMAVELVLLLAQGMWVSGVWLLAIMAVSAIEKKPDATSSTAKRTNWVDKGMSSIEKKGWGYARNDQTAVRCRITSTTKWLPT